MEQVTIWYLTDNEKGKKISESIGSLGLPVNLLEDFSLVSSSINESEINIFVFDFNNLHYDKIIESISVNKRIVPFQKFLILDKSDVKEANKKSVNIFHLEYISRPLNKAEFLLLLEKTIVVERYRQIMKYVSQEADLRIGLFEELMDINRKSIVETDKTKKVFSDIVAYEKNLMKEQGKLSKAIENFTMLRQQELFEFKSRIDAEEILSELKRQEMINDKKTIGAQESIISYSGQELKETKNLLQASEVVSELSRSEALELHEKMKILKEENENLRAELIKIKEER